MDDNTNQTRGSKTPMLIGAVVLASLVGLGAIMAMRANPETTDSSREIANSSPTAIPTSTPTPPAEALGAMDDSEVKTFTLEAGSFYFKPNVITVKKGDKVRVEIKSVDMMHNFTVEELEVATETVPAGETASVEFTAEEAGEYEFYCNVGQHRQRGQVGTLIVEE